MVSAFHIFLIAALFCFLQMLVLSSLLRSSISGVREWFAGNGLGIVASVLYAYGKELPPLIAYEAANGFYAAASAAVLAGFLRFYSRQVNWALLAAAVALIVIGIATFHYGLDSFALRTVTVSFFQAGICLAIALTSLRSRNTWRSRYPYVFTEAMAVVVAVGHIVRSIVYVSHPGELTSLLQPSAWNLLFLSAATMVLPVLTLGAVMMAHDRMLEKAEQAANRDFLTGAWSRRAFAELAERERALAQRAGRRFSLLVLDVDNFKTINDTRGHAAGDKVLIDVVSRAGTVLRNVDYFARIGGEEFAALLPDTDRSHALAVAERLRKKLEKPTTISGSKHGPSIVYTVSIGVAVLRDDESFEAVMQRADAALYTAKASGRNRVVGETDTVG